MVLSVCCTDSVGSFDVIVHCQPPEARCSHFLPPLLALVIVCVCCQPIWRRAGVSCQLHFCFLSCRLLHDGIWNSWPAVTAWCSWCSPAPGILCLLCSLHLPLLPVHSPDLRWARFRHYRPSWKCREGKTVLGIAPRALKIKLTEDRLTGEKAHRFYSIWVL